MPLSEDCTPGHIFEFTCRGSNAEELQARAIKVADQYFGDLSYEMTISDIKSVPSEFGYMHDFEGTVHSAVKYSDQYTRAVDAQRTNPFGPVFNTQNSEEGGDSTPSGAYA